MPRKVLGAGERARRLAPLDPAPHQAGHPVRIVAEGAGLHDGIVGQQVEVGDRREDPVDADGARLLRRDGSRPAHHRRVVERGERQRWRELRETRHLLPRPAFEVRGNEQRAARSAQQVGGEAPDRFGRAAEHDEPADADVERIGDARRFVTEAALGIGAKRGEDQPGGIGGGGGGAHAGVTVPRTRAALAPVAAGMFPGCPCSVR